MIRTIKLTIQYDGTAYHGWQSQPRTATVQGQIENALEKLCGCPIEITGSSRTDAGVHALGQVASFSVESPVPTENFVRALNQILPNDIAITEAVEVADSFEVISDTKSKTYRYTIYTGPVRPVMKINYCWHRPGTLDIENMQKAAKLLIGKKDFKSFASAADNRKSSVRTIFAADVTNQKDWIYFDIHGDGFLYNMVRNIVGTLIEVGRRRWPPEMITEILQAKDRSAAGPIAPPQGLCLMSIEY